MNQPQKPPIELIINNAFISSTGIQNTLVLLQDEIKARDNIIQKQAKEIEELKDKLKPKK